jgi:peptidoglycan/LPS O-acetylase OafA/YrhL
LENRLLKWKIEGKLSVYLDFFRWLAAVIVVLSHIKGLFFADYSDVEQSSVFLRMLYAVASSGHQAVIVFFVLSGLFISANVMKTIGKGTWSWKAYLTSRLTRLYIVLIPALIMGYAWDQAGIRLFAETGVYSGLPEDRYVLGYSTISHLTIENFAGNLFYLQGIVVGHYGSNGPLWSLSYEFWYYILFPCLALALTSNSRIKKAGYLIACVVLCLVIGQHILTYFLIWALGFAIHLLPALPYRFARACLLPLLVLTIASIVFYRLIPLNTFLADLAIGCLFSLLIYCMKMAMNTEKASLRMGKLSASLAGFSYTMYLAHFPFLVFIHAMLYSRNPSKWQPDASTLGYGFILLIGVLAYCWLISFITERRTQHVRERIVQLGSKKNPAAPSKGIIHF